MEIKHLRSDFIRSFLLAYYKDEVLELDAAESNTIDTLNIIHEYEIHTPAVVYVDFEINQNTLLSYITRTYLSQYTKYKTFYKNGTIAKILNTVFINKNKINTLEYYQDTLAFIQDITSNKDLLNEVLNNSYNEIYQNFLKGKREFLLNEAKELPNINSQRYDNVINKINNEINALLNKISELKVKLKYTYGQKIVDIINDDKNPFMDLINYALKCKIVKGFDLDHDNDTVQMGLFTDAYPLAYTFGDGALNKMINNSSFYKNDTNRHILYDALGCRETYEIILLPICITIIYEKGVPALSYDIRRYYNSSRIFIKNKFLNARIKSQDIFSNRHWFAHHCLGSFTADLNEARTQLNTVRLFATLLQYMSTINLTDGAGNYWLHQAHLIHNKKTNEYFLYRCCEGDDSKLEEVSNSDIELFKKPVLKDLKYWKED